MEWIIGIALVVGAWWLYSKNSGDTNLKRVRAINFMLERYAAGLKGANSAEFEKAIQLTIALKTGIHALTNNQSFMIDETVLSVFKQLSENDTVIYSLLKGSPEKINEFKYAFRDCHERLQLLKSS
ncbi:hypothetical protein PS914_03202 [Pseudomonas fluorescens]|uniref:hypothetical protein n=1 Tax=Pseudomonas fluorescens TaxID=294 RepID=UPI001242F3B2|nr:hypothetical protein [Pseudomonas fluorescens]VVP91831.1 hypothetical protein PS914_03202 [Pseudomonas fluorescens]